MVYDEDPFDDDFLGKCISPLTLTLTITLTLSLALTLGKCTIPLEQLRDKGPVNGWYRLENQGKIRLILEWTYSQDI